MPMKYEADMFWGYNQERGCYTQVLVGNMGEVGEMDMADEPFEITVEADLCGDGNWMTVLGFSVEFNRAVAHESTWSIRLPWRRLLD